MKFIMVIVFCMYGNCQTIYEENMYDSLDSCLQSSHSVSQYMKDTYPGSTGEIYCMKYEDFKKLEEQSQNQYNQDPA